MSIPSQPPKPPGSGNKTLLIVLAVLGGVALVVCGGLCAGLFVLGTAATRVVEQETQGVLDEIKKRRVGLEEELAPAMVAAIMAAETFPAVVEQIGTPLEPGDYHKIARDGSLDPAGEEMRFNVEGPKGDAVLHCLAVKENDRWRPTKITVTLPGGNVINVPDPPARPTRMKSQPNE